MGYPKDDGLSSHGGCLGSMGFFNYKGLTSLYWGTQRNTGFLGYMGLIGILLPLLLWIGEFAHQQ